MLEGTRACLFAALVAAMGCGGTTTGDEVPGKPGIEVEPLVVELRRVPTDAVYSIAADERTVYWTDIVKGGIFAVDRDGTGHRRVTTDENPYALSVSGSQLFWLSYRDLAQDLLQLSTVATNGEQRRELAIGTGTELGSHPFWRVPAEGEVVYWHELNSETRITTLFAGSRRGGDLETLFEVPGRVRQTWLSGRALYYSDDAGIHALDLATRNRSTLIADAYQLRDPVFVGNALYFIGHPWAEPLRDGLFQVQAGVARLVLPAELSTTLSRLASDGEHLYFADNRQPERTRLVELDPDTLEEREICLLPAPPTGNLVVEGKRLIVATSTAIYSIRTNATPQ